MGDDVGLRSGEIEDGLAEQPSSIVHVPRDEVLELRRLPLMSSSQGSAAKACTIGETGDNSEAPSSGVTGDADGDAGAASVGVSAGVGVRRSGRWLWCVGAAAGLRGVLDWVGVGVDRGFCILADVGRFTRNLSEREVSATADVVAFDDDGFFIRDGVECLVVTPRSLDNGLEAEFLCVRCCFVGFSTVGSAPL